VIRSRFRRGIALRLVVIVALLVPLLSGAFGAPVATGDELSAALAKQKALQAKIAAQKTAVAQLNGLQADLRSTIGGTSARLGGINADLATVRTQVTRMAAQVKAVQAAYDSLVAQVADLDAQLVDLQAQEAAKAAQLEQRKGLLAVRIRAAYDSDRTSLLETILSASSFSDVLSDVGYLIDIGNQDKALAEQIAMDRQTLLALDQTVTQTRSDTDQLRVDTGAQKKVLDGSLADLKTTKAQLTKLEVTTKRLLAVQQNAYARMATNAAALRRAMNAEAAAQAALKRRIDQLVAAQFQGGGIPSRYTGTLQWPLAGVITQEFGCTGFSWEPRYGNCAHYHNGIDIATDGQVGIPIHAAGSGRVVFAGPLSDGAWVVIIAHSANMSTWYAHVQIHIPVHVGQLVNTGDVIAYVGMTGNTTGPHLHWMVELNDVFANPRLFL
jgi:murein DD-endopeptidase MepM/ murein hydrolase activator NlpD